MTISVKDRVFSAADIISFECSPTVSMVHAATGVSKSEVIQYLDEWEKERRSEGDHPILNPGALPEGEPRLRHETSLSEQSTRTKEGQIAIEELAARISRLEDAYALLERQFRRAPTEQDAPQGPTIAARLAAAEARGDSWQQAFAALLQHTTLSERST